MSGGYGGPGGGGGHGPPPGGGGFGQPPGGGGFGPPPGGGGFGPPPGGGGFGQPPGGGQAPSGGGYGPPPGGGGAPPGGEAPLGRIPFTPDQEKDIQQTALFMRISGGLAIASALFGLVGSIGVNLYSNLPAMSSVPFGCVGTLVQGLLAGLLFFAAGAFAKIVSTDGEDQHHLADGLKKLRVYFLVKSGLWIMGFLCCCIGVVVFSIMGAAFLSLLGVAAGAQ